MVRLCTVGTIPLGIRYLTFFREIDVKIEVLRERLRKDAEERMVERCDKLTEQQDQFAQIFSRVEESIKGKMIAECWNFQSLNFKIHPM